jgi:hypothetical protein
LILRSSFRTIFYDASNICDLSEFMFLKNYRFKLLLKNLRIWAAFAALFVNSKAINIPNLISKDGVKGQNRTLGIAAINRCVYSFFGLK